MKVFLSSTAQDLTEYRRVADDTILRLSQQSIAMERFGPLPNTPVEECERLARESDVVICVVAHRYGFIPEKGRGSITQREVEAAHKAGRDVLVWIVSDDYPWSEKQEQDLLTNPEVLSSPEKITEVTEAIRELVAFKSWLLTTFTPERFTTPDDLGRKIAVALSNYAKGQAAPPVPHDKISISRLPSGGAELFGRETELQILDDAWANSNTNIVSFVAWGGVGKTALVNHWLKRRMARDNYRGADRVYAWSFFSQGTREGESSAELFIDQALRWFGDADPTTGNAWDRGERLARLIRQTRTLVILDGLEPLQHPPGPQEGRLKDPALQALLVELAAQQSGLCVISTRERIADLVEFEDGTVVQLNLEYLSPQAGAQILRSLNVNGEEQELEGAARELGGHAFSLTLLGSYLDEALDGDIRRRKEIENLFADTRYGDAAHQMIAAYEKWLGEGMELTILRLLGLFDRPADRECIEALRQPPVIVGLTEPLQDFKRREWNQAVSKLRRVKLLSEASINDSGALDAHPLVRAYFKQYLKLDRPDVWTKANDRLYEHLKQTANNLPDTVEEMTPLYVAVTHGCAAGRYEEVLYEVYSRRIQRNLEFYNWHTLGAYGADLAALSEFFEEIWDRLPATLSAFSQGLIFNQVGVDLRAVGRLHEAIHPASAGLELMIEDEDWVNASKASNNLLQLYLTIGDLAQALAVAQRGVELADRGNDMFVRGALRASVGDIFHQLGRIDEAIATFDEVSKLKPENVLGPLNNSWWGFLYCDLLLAEGLWKEARERSEVVLKHSTENRYHGNMGLDNVTLARSWIVGVPKDIKKASDLVHGAVDLLRRGGRLDRLPYGLMAQAVVHRHSGDLVQAERDLMEVHRLATRSGMNIFLADYHLESGRLRVAQKDKEKARGHLLTAKEMINRMGYHRRDKEVQELEAQLA
jgi:tetratricopeptide (TPR) repeat protein